MEIYANEYHRDLLNTCQFSSSENVHHKSLYTLPATLFKPSIAGCEILKGGHLQLWLNCPSVPPGWRPPCSWWISSFGLHKFSLLESVEFLLRVSSKSAHNKRLTYHWKLATYAAFILQPFWGGLLWLSSSSWSGSSECAEHRRLLMARRVSSGSSAPHGL